jgi:hypothetical protein
MHNNKEIGHMVTWVPGPFVSSLRPFQKGRATAGTQTEMLYPRDNFLSSLHMMQLRKQCDMMALLCNSVTVLCQVLTDNIGYTSSKQLTCKSRLDAYLVTTSLYCILNRTHFQFAQFRTRKYFLAMIGTFRKKGLYLGT